MGKVRAELAFFPLRKRTITSDVIATSQSAHGNFEKYIMENKSEAKCFMVFSPILWHGEHNVKVNLSVLSLKLKGFKIWQH